MALAAAGRQGWFCLNIIRMGQGLEPDMNMTCLDAARLYDENEADTNSRRLEALASD